MVEQNRILKEKLEINDKNPDFKSIFIFLEKVIENIEILEKVNNGERKTTNNIKIINIIKSQRTGKLLCYVIDNGKTKLIDISIIKREQQKKYLEFLEKNIKTQHQL